jgi:hypothetical protein
MHVDMLIKLKKKIMQIEACIWSSACGRELTTSIVVKCLFLQQVLLVLWRTHHWKPPEP